MAKKIYVAVDPIIEFVKKLNANKISELCFISVVYESLCRNYAIKTKGHLTEAALSLSVVMFLVEQLYIIHKHQTLCRACEVVAKA